MGLAPYAQKIDRSTYEILIAVLNLMDIKLILIKNRILFHFEKKLRGKRFDVSSKFATMG